MVKMVDQGARKRLMQNVEKIVAGFFAGAVAMTIAGGAVAQQTSPRPPAKHKEPVEHAAQQPPAAQPAPQIQPVQTTDAPQRTTATYDDWIVQCETRPGPPLEKLCDMAQVTQVQGRNTPFSRVAIPRPAKGEPVKLVVQLPVNASFATNVHLQTGDGDTGIAVPFARCLPAGCFADIDIGEDALKKFRAASSVGKLSFADASGRDVAVPVSFKGFAQAFDALGRE
jgi:invasion protein IalB